MLVVCTNIVLCANIVHICNLICKLVCFAFLGHVMVCCVLSWKVEPRVVRLWFLES
jgi:hypothetical protein